MKSKWMLGCLDFWKFGKKNSVVLLKKGSTLMTEVRRQRYLACYCNLYSYKLNGEKA